MSRRKSPAKRRNTAVTQQEPRQITVDYQRAIRLVANVEVHLLSALAGLSTPEDAQWLTPIARASKQLARLIGDAVAAEGGSS